jgi:uncharacterized protein (TIGR03435 family)
MKREFTGTLVALGIGWLCLAQSSEAPPKFEAADVHPSAQAAGQQFVRTSTRNGRYEVKAAMMVDLIHIAYGFDADKILGGPNWLELDRFDISAKIPAETSNDMQKQMLRSLIEERFKLVTHKDTKPLATYVLTMGKKTQLKEAADSGETGCKPKAASGAPTEGSVRIMTMNQDGQSTVINLGPGMTIQYQCRNLTMEAFAASLRGLMGANLGPNAVVDETGLKGKWDFDLSFSMALFGPMASDTGERVTIFSAVEKQLGLKLEEKPIPTPVLVVDSVERRPTANPPGTADLLPPAPAATEFEVGTIKPTDASTRMSRFMIQPGGRVMIEGMPLQFIINRAFNTNNNQAVVGLPSSMAMDRYDVVAKLPADVAPFVGQGDMDAVSKPLLALVTDRFQMKYHTEDRPVAAYSLTAGKPKIKKADPAGRIFCRNTNAPAPAPPGTREIRCQNVTMAQFAERLQYQTQELSWPVEDATGLEGTWDLDLTFSMRAGMSFGGRGGDAGGGINAVPSASDPTGELTLFEAIEKELGLKLEKQKRTLPVVVIDHIGPKPTDN